MRKADKIQALLEDSSQYKQLQAANERTTIELNELKAQMKMLLLNQTGQRSGDKFEDESENPEKADTEMLLDAPADQQQVPPPNELVLIA